MEENKVPPLNLTNYNWMLEELMRHLLSTATVLNKAGASREAMYEIEKMGHHTFDLWKESQFTESTGENHNS